MFPQGDISHPSFLFPANFMTIKSGNRNSKEDKKRIQAIKAHAMNINAMATEMEPDPEDPAEPTENAAGEPSIKAANLFDWIISRIHMNFTDMADNLYGDGILTQDERKTLSGAIGAALDAYNVFATDKLANLKERRPYSEAPPPAATSMIKALDDLHCVKALGSNRVGGYMALWGDNKAKDLEGEWFTPQTAEMTSIFKAMGKLPYLYNHATDGTVKTDVIGQIDVLQPDDTGLWYEAQLNTANKYLSAIRKLVSAKALGTSSGTLPGARQVAKSGEILRWPIVEGSATPTPCDPRQIAERPVAELKSLYKSIGLEFPESTGGKGDEESRQKAITAKLKLLDLLEVESGVYLL